MRASAAAVRQSIERDTEYADTLVQRMRADEESDWPDRLLHHMALVPSEIRRPLTPAEGKALSCRAVGLTNEETAATLGLTLETVKRQLLTARRVLRAKNTTHACCLALRQGLIA